MLTNSGFGLMYSSQIYVPKAAKTAPTTRRTNFTATEAAELLVEAPLGSAIFAISHLRCGDLSDWHSVCKRQAELVSPISLRGRARAAQVLSERQAVGQSQVASGMQQRRQREVCERERRAHRKVSPRAIRPSADTD